MWYSGVWHSAGIPLQLCHMHCRGGIVLISLASWGSQVHSKHFSKLNEVDHWPTRPLQLYCHHSSGSTKVVSSISDLSISCFRVLQPPLLHLTYSLQLPPQALPPSTEQHLSNFSTISTWYLVCGMYHLSKQEYTEYCKINTQLQAYRVSQLIQHLVIHQA